MSERAVSPAQNALEVVQLPTAINMSNPRRGSLQTEVVSLTELRNCSWREIKHDSVSADATILRAIATLAKRQWLHTRPRYSHHDSIADIHDLFTRADAQTILLWGNSPRRFAHIESRQLVGAGLVLTSEQDIPDFDDMPWTFLREQVLPAFPEHGPPRICRGIRAFVSPAAYVIAPTERPLDLLTAAANELSAGGIIVTKIHADNPRARNAFVSLGYESTGRFTADGQYEWLVFPPFSSKALKEQTLAQKQVLLLSMNSSRDVTHAATYFDPLGADLAIIGSKKQVLQESDQISRVFPFSPVLSFVETGSAVSSRRERPNLSFLTADQGDRLLPDKQVSGTLVTVDTDRTDISLEQYVRQAANTTCSGGKVLLKLSLAQAPDTAILAHLLLQNGLRLISSSILADGAETTPTSITVAEKVTSSQSIAIVAAGGPVSVPDAEQSFVHFTYLRNKTTGRQWELGTFDADMALDALPYFEHTGQLYIGLVNRPRPIPHLLSDTLDGSAAGAFLAEQVSAFTHPPANGSSVREYIEAARRDPSGTLEAPLVELLAERSGILPGMTDASSISFQHYYSSPGTVGEAVLACTIQVDPFRSSHRDPRATNFVESGLFQPVPGQRALAAAHLGALSDGRVERMVYAVYTELKRDPGVWLGTPVELTQQNRPPVIKDISALRSVPERAAFERLPEARQRHYLDHRRISVSEIDQHSNVLSEVALEYIEPHHATGISNNTISFVPLMRHENELYIGLELRDLPAPQLHGFSSAFYAVPAYRLPKSVRSLGAANQFLTEHLTRDFGLTVARPQRLGARYFPTAGLTPETVYPLIAECLDHSPLNDDLHWFPIRDVLQSLPALRGGHTLTSLYRTAHALGLFQQKDAVGM